MHALGDERGALTLAIAQSATRDALRHWPQLRHWRDDMLSDATLGATLARNSYDPARGVTFTTYAWHRAHGQILDGIRERSPLPRSAVARGEQPPPVLSLDGPAGTGHGERLALVDLIPDQRLPFDELCHRDELRRLFARLTPQQAYVVAQVDLCDRTLLDVATELEISESRVCQIRLSALRTMRGKGTAWITQQQVCELLYISRHTCARWVRNGTLTVHPGHGRCRFRRDEVEALLR